MIRYQLLKYLRRPRFYFMAVGIGILKYLAVFTADAQINRMVFSEKSYMGSIFSVNYMNQWLNFLEYGVLCMCAYAVSGGVLEDISEQMYDYLFVRVSVTKYCAGKVIAMVIAGFLCMSMGCIVFYLMNTIFPGLPLFPAIDSGEALNYSKLLSEILGQQNFALFLILQIVQYSCFGVVVSLLVMMISLVIHDFKFLITLPIIFMYFFVNVFRFKNMTWLNIFYSPYEVYCRLLGANDFVPEGIPIDLISFGFPVLYTILAAILAYILLFRTVRKWKVQ